MNALADDFDADTQTAAKSPIGWPTMTRPGCARLPALYVPHMPEPPQRAFLCMNVLEAFYGGAAGGGKSDALLMGALQFVDVPRYAAILFRKTYQDLTLPGALMDRADEWLRDTPAKWNSSTHTWKFPSTATLTFGYLDNPKDAQRYRSAEFQYVGFDESTQHALAPYRFLFTRLRRPALPCAFCRRPVQLEANGAWSHKKDGECLTPSPDERAFASLGRAHDGLTVLDVPLRMRAASNPGDVGHAWHLDRFVTPAANGVTTRPFVPSALEDNPYLDADEYEKSLREQDPVNWLRLRRGDWSVRDAGEVFDRANVQVIEQRWESSRTVQRCRRWDLASTDPKAGNDPDWTVGALVARNTATGEVCIEHVARIRSSALGVEKLMRQTAELDGREVTQVIEQEPGASGKLFVSHVRRNVLGGYRCEAQLASGAKELRVRTLIPVVEGGDLSIVQGEWNSAFLDEFDSFPNVTHDDQVDAVSGGYIWLNTPKSRLLV